MLSFTGGVLTSIITLIFMFIETAYSKELLKKYGNAEFAAIKTTLIVPITLLFFMRGFYISDEGYLSAIILTVIALVNNYTQWYALGKLNLVVHDMVRKLSVFIVALLTALSGVESLVHYHFIGVLVLTSGLFLTIKYNSDTKGNKIDKVALLMGITSCTFAALNSVYVKYIMSNNLMSIEATVVVKILGMFIVFNLISKPRYRGIYKDLKLFLFVGLSSIGIMFLSTFSVQYAGVVVYNSIIALTGLLFLIFNLAKGVEEFNIRKFSGILLSIIGSILVILASMGSNT